MTTIVYSQGVLAADTRAYSGGGAPIGQKRKIFRLADGSIVGCSTTEPGLSEAMIKWLGSPSDQEPTFDEFKGQVLLIKPDGSVFYFSDSTQPSGPLFGEFFAIGSGTEYAIGALSLGATAEQAVLVAAKHDAWTNDQVQSLMLHEPPEADNENAEPQDTSDNEAA